MPKSFRLKTVQWRPNAVYNQSCRDAYLFTMNEHIVELYVQQRLRFPSECASLSSGTRLANS
jgi:hypothetical protein